MRTTLSLGMAIGLVIFLAACQSAHPNSANVAGPGEHCGGNMATARACTTGYHCAPSPNSHLPFGDVGGTCVAN